MRNQYIEDLSDEQLDALRKLLGKEDIAYIHVGLASGDDYLLKTPKVSVSEAKDPNQLDTAFATAACLPPCRWVRTSGGWVCVC